jgi:DNA-binding NtrC family response regulator
MLAEHFLTMICEDHGIPRKTFTEDGFKALQQTNWTGNIRELRNIIERLVILCGDSISGDDVNTFANPKVTK